MKKKFIKSLLIIFLILILGLTIFLSAGGNVSRLMGFVDYPSLIIVVFPTVFMLFFADLMGDYCRGVRFIFGNTEYTTKEIKTSINALDLSIKLVIITGVLGSFIGLIMNFINYGGDVYSSEVFYINIALNLMPLFYALIWNLIQLPIRYNLQKEITYREN